MKHNLIPKTISESIVYTKERKKINVDYFHWSETFQHTRAFHTRAIIHPLGKNSFSVRYMNKIRTIDEKQKFTSLHQACLSAIFVTKGYIGTFR